MSSITDRMADAYARINGFNGVIASKDVVGPHVITPTGDTIRVHAPDFNGDVPQWRCKYCGRTGTHPDDPGHTSFSWEKACEGFEPLESEIESLNA